MQILGHDFWLDENQAQCADVSIFDETDHQAVEVGQVGLLNSFSLGSF